MPLRGLSISDYTVLGIVGRDGPCTTYSVMMDMADSPSSFYRKRASSTYTVVQRLTGLGLVKPLDEDPGPRGERQIALTDEGMRALKEWMSPIPTVEAAHSNDLVRLRVNFLSLLAPDERLAFLDGAVQTLSALLEESERTLPERHDPIRRLTLLGLIFETRARLAWLEEVRKTVASSSLGREGLGG